MTEEERRRLYLLAKGIKSELSKISVFLKGIKDGLDAVSNPKVSEQHPNEPKPSQLVVSVSNVPSAIDSYYIAEQKERPSKSFWWKVKLVAELIVGGAVVGYTITTGITLNQVTKQASAAADAAASTRKQVEIMQSGQRPWLGLAGQVQIDKTTTIGPYYPKTGTVGTSLSVNGTFLVRNFGTAPAFNENSDVAIRAAIYGDEITRPEFGKGFGRCLDGNTMLGNGEVLFPGAPVTQAIHFQAVQVIPNKVITEVRRIWMVGCISYSDAPHSKEIHHTKFWLRSTFPDFTPWIQMTPQFRYMPFTGFESWGQEAN